MLRSIIEGNGWAKTTSDIIHGGGLLAKGRLPDVGPLPEADVDAKAFAEKPAPEFEVSEKEREAIKRAIKFFAESGNIKPSSFSLEVLLAFGFTAE